MLKGEIALDVKLSVGNIPVEAIGATVVAGTGTTEEVTGASAIEEVASQA